MKFHFSKVECDNGDEGCSPGVAGAVGVGGVGIGAAGVGGVGVGAAGVGGVGIGAAGVGGVGIAGTAGLEDGHGIEEGHGGEELLGGFSHGADGPHQDVFVGATGKSSIAKKGSKKGKITKKHDDKEKRSVLAKLMKKRSADDEDEKKSEKKKDGKKKKAAQKSSKEKSSKRSDVKASKKNDIIVKRPPVIYHPPPEIYHRPPIIVHRPPLVIRRPPIIYHQPPVIVHRPAVVYHQPPLVFHQPPPAVSQPILKSHDTFMMHPAARLSHMGSMVTNSGTYVGVPEHRFMYQGGMGYFHSPQEAHGDVQHYEGEGEHTVEGGMGGGQMIEAPEQGGFSDGGAHQDWPHGGGAFGRDQVEENNGGDQPQEGGSQEGNYLKGKKDDVENTNEKQKDTSEKRKSIARPDSKSKHTINKLIKKVSKRQIMSAAYPREYSGGYPAYVPSYSPYPHEKRHHKTRVDVDVVGKRSVPDAQEQQITEQQNHFLF